MKYRIVAVLLSFAFAGSAHAQQAPGSSPAPGSASSQSAKSSRFACYPTDRGCCSSGSTFDSGSYNRDNKFCTTTVSHPSNGKIGSGGTTGSTQQASTTSSTATRQATQQSVQQVQQNPTIVTPIPTSPQQVGNAIQQGRAAAAPMPSTQGVAQGNLAVKTVTP